MVRLTVNGAQHELELDPRTAARRAARAPRPHRHQEGLRPGQCGACTVLVDGRRDQLSCLDPGRQRSTAPTVTTIEGLAAGDALHPMQEAFIAHDAFQCGYCTPGQIMSRRRPAARGRRPATDPSGIRECMSGNLCRCGAYAEHRRRDPRAPPQAATEPSA